MEHTYHHGYDTVFKKCQETLSDLRIGIDHSDKSNHLIKASTSGTLVSWGEKIEIKFLKAAANQTKVIVESSANAQLFAWGKNVANEENIINGIKEKLGR